jgi:hypothetical protein
MHAIKPNFWRKCQKSRAANVSEFENHLIFNSLSAQAALCHGPLKSVAARWGGRIDLPPKQARGQVHEQERALAPLIEEGIEFDEIERG